MRIPTKAGYAIAAAASIALLAGCSGGTSSGPAGSALPGASGTNTQSVGHGLSGPQLRSLPNHGVVPDKILALLPKDLRRPVASQFKKNPPGTQCFPFGYLSNNLSGVVYTFTRPTSSTYGTLHAESGQLYGWGAAAGASTIYLGTDVDTIDTIAPCGPDGSQTRSVYQGSDTGTPYGMDVDGNQNLVANEWPTTTIDQWAAGHTGSPTSQGTDANMEIVYFVFYDRSGNLWDIGYNLNGTEQVDKCPGAVTSSCAPFATITSGFPGGGFVDKNGNVVANNQFGTLYSYNSSAVLLSTFTYSNGTNPLDYTAIRLSKGGTANKEAHAWGANIYLCSTCSFGIGTNAQNQSYDPSTGAVGPLDPASGPISNDEALGLALYQGSNQP